MKESMVSMVGICNSGGNDKRCSYYEKSLVTGDDCRHHGYSACGSTIAKVNASIKFLKDQGVWEQKESGTVTETSNNSMSLTSESSEVEAIPKKPKKKKKIIARKAYNALIDLCKSNNDCMACDLNGVCCDMVKVAPCDWNRIPKEPKE